MTMRLLHLINRLSELYREVGNVDVTMEADRWVDVDDVVVNVNTALIVLRSNTDKE